MAEIILSAQQPDLAAARRLALVIIRRVVQETAARGESVNLAMSIAITDEDGATLDSVSFREGLH